MIFSWKLCYLIMSKLYQNLSCFLCQKAGTFDGALAENRSSSCSSPLQGWSYAQCPDVDECALGLHDCHEESGLCRNTPVGFECSCKRGFEGDGRRCERTCEEDCGEHGECSGEPGKEKLL